MFKLNESSKKWYVTTTINFGYLKEAYFNALMREHGKELDYLCKVELGSGRYGQRYGSEEEMTVFYKYYIQELDNASFGFTGDVQAIKKIDDGKSVYSSYAVKGSSFSFGSIEPIAKMAENIVNIFIPMIEKNKKEILRQLILKSETGIHQSIYLYSIDKAKKVILNTISKVDENNKFTDLLVAQGAELTSLK